MRPAGGRLVSLAFALSGAACNVVRPLPDAGPGFTIPDAGAPDGAWTELVLLAGQPGATGREDGFGPGARFDNPQGVAAAAGAIFVADSSGSTLRRFEPDGGAVRTVAGIPGVPGALDGTGDGAAFDAPAGLAAGAQGILYLADSGNHAIRRVDTATLSVSTVAGRLGIAGSADGVPGEFRLPRGVAWDGAGALYVADSGNDTVRRVDLATGGVTTVAGTAGRPGDADGPAADAGFNDPGGIAADGAGHVFVADTGNDTLREIDLDAGVVSTLAGSPRAIGSDDGPGSGARFAVPLGLTLDGQGGLLVADSQNGTIRRVALGDGNDVSTIVGVPTQQSIAPGPLPASLDAPSALALDPAGHLLLLDDDALLEVR